MRRRSSTAISSCPAIALDPSLAERWRELEYQRWRLERGLIEDAIQRQRLGF